MRKKRILFAAVDIGYRINTYTGFINRTFSEKLEVESMSKYKLPETHYQTNYTHVISIYSMSKILSYFKLFLFFLKTLYRYDILHFFSGETILTWKLRGLELRIYKILGKNVIMHFVGSDIRSENYLNFKREFLIKYLQNKIVLPEFSDRIQQKLIKNSFKNSNKNLVSTPDLLTAIPNAVYLPVMLDFDEFYKTIGVISFDEPDKIRILHSPSGFGLKGSEYINSVLDEIQRMYLYNIEIILPGKNEENRNIYSMTRYELLKTFKSVDIVIDQLLIGWYGLKSVEALATGCEVVCFIEDKLEKYLGENCPIVNANAINLKQKLIELIEKLLVENNRKKRLEINKKFVYKYHHIQSYQAFFERLWLN